MFINLLPTSDKMFSVSFSKYSENHFLKTFQKKYPGKQWELTLKSILEDLARLRMPNNETQRGQQIDELKHFDECWIAKYDFRVAGTKESTKGSGNRCIVFIDVNKNKLEILLIYNKTDLPKNKDETVYIFDVLEEQYPDYMSRFVNINSNIK